MRNILNLAIGFLVMLPLSACGASGGPVAGQILEAGTKKPIPEAIVIVRWQGTYSRIVDSQDVCYHVETATTDAEGRFRTPGWVERKPRGPFFSPGGWDITAYKPGYETDWPAAYSATEDYKRNIRYLKPFTGTKAERLKYLMHVLEAARCGATDGSERNLHPLYKTLYEEGSGIALTKREKEMVDSLRYWSTFVLFDSSKPSTRDEKGRLINIDPEAQKK